MIISHCSSDTAESVNNSLKKWCLCEVFCKICELVTKLTVVLIRVKKAIFDVDEKGPPLEFGRYRRIIPLNASLILFVSFLKHSSQ